MDDSGHGVLAYMGFPEQHRARLRGANLLERLNEMGYPGQQACGMDAAGQVVRERSVASTPEAIAAAVLG